MFDITKPFAVEIQSGGTIKCRCSYPSDKQWIARTAKQKTMRVEVGRGRSKYESTPVLDGDLALLEKIRLPEDGTDAFDKFEANLVIELLARCELASCEKETDNVFAITVGVFGGGETVHRLRSPKRADMHEYDGATISTVHTKNGSETTISLEPGGRMYDKLLVSTEGYAENSAVPLIHKTMVIAELVRANSPE